MPTYANSGVNVITKGSMRVEPGSSEESVIFYQNLPTGLTQTAAIPFFDPILYSVKVTSSSTINIPTSILENYKITIVVTAGEVSVKYNASTANALILGAGMVEETKCSSRIVDNLIFTISSGTAYVIIKKI
jgi:hypothetical protein